ncbi:hypothetical protein FOA52_015783 [Chlamydomonas sp. UWO 241]|nr:hypothetical protein FOA52_015783 [Chlamydomonas sp. UWO 241]
MARTKQTRRKGTCGKAPRKELQPSQGRLAYRSESQLLQQDQLATTPEPLQRQLANKSAPLPAFGQAGVLPDVIVVRWELSATLQKFDERTFDNEHCPWRRGTRATAPGAAPPHGH